MHGMCGEGCAEGTDHEVGTGRLPTDRDLVFMETVHSPFLLCDLHPRHRIIREELSLLLWC